MVVWPKNPNIGDIYTISNGSKWKWNGKAWISANNQVIINKSGGVITQEFSHSLMDPVDNMSYYIGNIGDSPAQSNSTQSRRVKSSVTGKIKEATISTQIIGNIGTSEDQIFKINNFTTNESVDIIINYKNLSNSQLNVYTLNKILNVDKGDELEIIWKVGVFEQSPTLVRNTFNIYIEY